LRWYLRRTVTAPPLPLWAGGEGEAAHDQQRHDRSAAGSRAKDQPGQWLAPTTEGTPLRTLNGWSELKEAGWLEIDLVAHCGKWMESRLLGTLVATDMATGWSECLPRRVEQKNGMLTRRVVGYQRMEGLVAAELLGELYGALRLFTNLYQPSFKRKETIREGGKLKRSHHPPRTPQERLLALSQLRVAQRKAQEGLQRSSDPVALLETFRRCRLPWPASWQGKKTKSKDPGQGRWP